MQETKKNVVSNPFFHEFIGNFKLKTKGTPKIFKEMMMLIDKAKNHYIIFDRDNVVLQQLSDR